MCLTMAPWILFFSFLHNEVILKRWLYGKLHPLITSRLRELIRLSVYLTSDLMNESSCSFNTADLYYNSNIHNLHTYLACELDEAIIEFIYI